jgi:hypothetical protein
MENITYQQFLGFALAAFLIWQIISLASKKKRISWDKASAWGLLAVLSLVLLFPSIRAFWELFLNMIDLRH